MSDMTERAYQRLTTTEVARALLARAPQQPESTCEISRNAKGQYQFAIAVRDPDPNHAYSEAVKLAKQAARDFPFMDIA